MRNALKDDKLIHSSLLNALTIPLENCNGLKSINVQCREAYLNPVKYEFPFTNSENSSLPI